jgi:hypothetical protein
MKVLGFVIKKNRFSDEFLIWNWTNNLKKKCKSGEKSPKKQTKHDHQYNNEQYNDNESAPNYTKDSNQMIVPINMKIM